MEKTRTERVTRSTAAASLATFVALLSHVAAGGAMPGWIGVVVPWVFSIIVCVPLSGRRLSVIRLSLAVLLSQALFHTLFVLGAGASGSLVGAGHHGTIVLAGTDAAAPVAASALSGDAVMWASHAVAAALTVAALYRGESTLHRLLALAAETGAWVERHVQAVVCALTGFLPSDGLPPLLPGTDDAPRLLRPVHLAVVVRRGPPIVSW